MSDTSQGPGWWLASDGKWYPPQAQSGYWAPPRPESSVAQPPYPAVPYPVAPYPGAPYPGMVPQFQPRAPKPTNGLAIASLVLSIIWLGGLGSILAVIFGIVARRQIRRSQGRQGGDGLALAGLLVGIVGLLGVALVWGLFFAVQSSIDNASRNQIADCRADARSVETALEAYDAQNMSYPRLLAPWSSATYLANYSMLTTANHNGGPWLGAAPPTGHYVIEFDSNGHVWVQGVLAFNSTYDQSQDFATNPNACNVAFP
jgi:hypothetical protein